MIHQPISKSVSEAIAKGLLEVGAVKLRPQAPFQWASGWMSPIYCDNRLTLSYPEFRKTIKEALADLVKFTLPEIDAIAGVATAGIPQAALVADILNLPMLYVRSAPKDHGMGNRIEGRIIEGAKVLVIEDLVSTGKSSLQAVEALRAAGMKPIAMAAVFSYGFTKADEAFKNANVNLFTLTNYPALVEVAAKTGYIQPQELELLQQWRTSPETWGS